MGTQDREFIRHPVDIPIEVQRRDDVAGTHEEMHDLSLGGLSFESDQPRALGQYVVVRLAAPFKLEISGRVVWCHRSGEHCGDHYGKHYGEHYGEHYEVGLSFGSQAEAFKGRMIEQICHIEQYRRDAQRLHGRDLSLEEAAREWIGQYADHFAPQEEQTAPPDRPDTKE